ncbi:MAG: M28 family peptidase [Fibrobacterota bacterium]
MRRREFIGLFGQGASAALLLGGCAQNGPPAFLDTPPKRRAYLQRLLKSLCTDIGPRPAGSPEYELGAGILQAEMRNALGSATLNSFTFTAWKLAGVPSFWVGADNLDIYPTFGAPSTPLRGIEGFVRKLNINGKLFYAVADPEPGPVWAYIHVSHKTDPYAETYENIPGERAPQSSKEFDIRPRTPMFTVGQKDVYFLESAIQDAIPVRYLAPVEYVRNAVTSNMEGVLQGDFDEEVLVLAHADTQYNTPGANDNTATVIAMLMLAHALSHERTGRTITFLATSGKEYGSLGARHYCEWRKQQGTLSRIRYCVNLDSLTYGPTLLLDSPHEALKKLVRDAHRDAKANGECKFYSNAPFLDDKPFSEEGIRTIYINTENIEATKNLWHTPRDREEQVLPELVENAYGSLLTALRHLRDPRFQETA